MRENLDLDLGFFFSGLSFNESFRRLCSIIYLNAHLLLINENNYIQIGITYHELCHG